MAELAAPFGTTETFHYLKTIAPDAATRPIVRAILRGLTNRGLCKFANGLMNEDGEVAGSGYAITQEGLEMAKTENKNQPEETQ